MAPGPLELTEKDPDIGSATAAVAFIIISLVAYIGATFVGAHWDESLCQIYHNVADCEWVLIPANDVGVFSYPIPLADEPPINIYRQSPMGI